MTLKSLKSKPGLALFGASGMIAVAAFAGTTMITRAASPTPSTSAQAAPAEAAEAPGTEAPEAPGTEKPEANEPALPGGGHADEAPGAAESAVDHQFNGVE
jgi:hypothetical protein